MKFLLAFLLLFSACAIVKDRKHAPLYNLKEYNPVHNPVVKMGRLKINNKVSVVAVVHEEGDEVDYVNLSKDFNLRFHTIEEFFKVYSLDILKAYLKKSPRVYTSKYKNFARPILAAGTNIAISKGYPKPRVTFSNFLKVNYYPKKTKSVAAYGNVKLDAFKLMDFGASLALYFPDDFKKGDDVTKKNIGVILVNNFVDRAAELKNLKRSELENLSIAASGDEKLAIGPFVVFPHDLQDFLNGQKLELKKNKILEQRMQTNLLRYTAKQAVENVFRKNANAVWPYEKERISLYDKNRIARGSLLIMGTAYEQQLKPNFVPGTAFFNYIFGFGFTSGSFKKYKRKKKLTLIKRKKLYIKTHDVVTVESSSLGKIETKFIR